jgi:DNA-binding IclR family transcriptional regulator
MSNSERMPRRPRHRMVDRVVELLECAARSDRGLTLTDLAREVDAPLSTVQSLVSGLAAAGLLSETDKRYSLGPAPYLLSMMADRPLVRSVGVRELQALHDDVGQPVVLAVRMSRAVYYVESVGDLATFRFLSDKLVPRPVLRTSAGRVIAAHLDQRDLWDLVQDQPGPEAETVAAYLRELDGIRADGMAYCPGLSDSGLHGLATIVLEGGRPVAAVAITGEADSMTRRREEFAGELRRHRRSWARQLD